MYLNIIRYFCRFIALAGIAILIVLATDPQSAVSNPSRPALRLSWSGHPVALTPFDLKMMASGFYKILPQSPPNNRRTLQEIFNQAASFQYRHDSGGDVWQDPDVTERTKAGDCEDMALWIYRELMRNGYDETRIMVGKFEAKDARHHTWVVCRLEGHDVILDPALQRSVWLRTELLPDLYLPSYSFDGRVKYTHSVP